MKVVITVTRRTTYSSIVEMSKEEFKRLDVGLKNDEGVEAEIDDLIDTRDWVCDTLDDIEEFKPYKEQK